MKTLFVFLLALMGAAPASARAFTAGALKIDRPWSRETGPNATVGVGFLRIQNFGKTADRLLAIKSTAAKDIAIHTMTMDGGVMQMRPLMTGLTIPAGGDVTLQPGAEHIMFMGLNGPIKQGQDFKATLVFERAGEVDVVFQVEPAGAKPVSGHAH